jgi:hypothetical protein
MRRWPSSWSHPGRIGGAELASAAHSASVGPAADHLVDAAQPVALAEFDQGLSSGARGVAGEGR